MIEKEKKEIAGGTLQTRVQGGRLRRREESEDSKQFIGTKYDNIVCYLLSDLCEKEARAVGWRQTFNAHLPQTLHWNIHSTQVPM